MTGARIDSVFGASRKPRASHVPRPALDDRLASALDADAHFVVWGEPRQGKSTLLRTTSDGDGYAVIQCSYGHKRYDVYRMLLRAVGASVTVEKRRKRSRGVGAKVTFLSGSVSHNTEIAEQTIDIDISNVNDVLNIAEDRGFRKQVILEDFHCLGRSTQRNIIQDLKVIYEKSELRIAIVGTWGDRGWLRSLPGDLAAPLSAIEVPRWSAEELHSVLDAGAEALEIEFSPEVAKQLVEASHESVGLLQDLAQIVCQQGLQPPQRRLISSVDLVDDAIDHVLQSSVGRLRWYVANFTKAPSWRRKSKAALFKKGVAHAVLAAPDDAIREGLSQEAVFDSIKELYRYEATNFTLGDLVRRLDRIQGINRDLRASPILSYDPARERLQIVDPMARLFLSTGDRKSLVEYLPNEGQDTETTSQDFRARVMAHYGLGCAVCPVTEPSLMDVVRLSDPAGADVSAPEYGLPLCATHSAAWDNDLFGIDPATTDVVCEDPASLGITRTSLMHLPARPAEATLTEAMASKRLYTHTSLSRLLSEKAANDPDEEDD